ncbi:MAG: DUF4344 domain-containing metallopeptidase [Pyrinomonadaceae bacterium]
MLEKFPKGNFKKNSSNLIFISAILIFIMACVCQSDRNKSAPDNSNSTETPPSSNTSQTTAAKKDRSKKEDRGDFIVEHIAVQNSKYVEIDRQVKENKTLEKAADRLNRSLILPNDIYLRTKDCGQSNAFYNPDDESITVCYELMEHFYQIFRSVGDTDQKAYDSMFDAITFVFLHEMGHALIDQYKLPVTGNEEDAADRLSSFVCIEELGDGGVRAILAAADAMRIESKMSKTSERDMADEHLLQEQRFFNSLCMVYGSNPDKYPNFVDKGYLPQERAVRCPSEYERTAGSWSDLLSPWRKS